MKARQAIRSALLGGLLVVLLLFGALAASALRFTVARAKPAELIPREVLFGNPDRAAVQLSPDGRYISFVAPWEGVRNVWVAPADAPDAAVPVTRDQGRGVAGYYWTYLKDRLLYLQDRDGDENWRVYSVDVSTGNVVDLTPMEGVQAQIVSISPEQPGVVLIQLNDRVPFYHDVYAVDVITGERTLLYQNNEGFLGFMADAHHEIKYAMAMTPDGGAVYFQRHGDEWAPMDVVGADDLLTTGPVTLTRAGDALYYIDSRGRDTAALVRRDLITGQEQVLYEDPQADTELVMLDPATWEAQAVASHYDRRRWEILDDAVAADFAFLRTVADGDLHVVGRTQADDLWIVAYDMDVSPVRYYLYDRSSAPGGIFVHQPQSAGKLHAGRHAPRHHSGPGRFAPGQLLVAAAVDGRDGGRPLGERAVADGAGSARRAVGAGRVGLRRRTSMAGQPRLRGAERELPRVHRVRQSLYQCRQPGVGRQNAGRFAGRRGLGRRGRHRRSRPRRHLRRLLRRLRGADGLDADARRLRGRCRHRRPV